MGRAKIVFSKEQLEKLLGIESEITGIYRHEPTDGLRINIKGEKLPKLKFPSGGPRVFSLKQIHEMEKEVD